MALAMILGKEARMTLDEPEKMAEIAKELKKSNDIQSKRNSILEEQNRLLIELCHLKATNPDVQKES